MHDPDPQAIEALRTEVPAIESVAADVVAAADYVFLAFHPPLLPGALAEIKPLLRRDAILVSLAPKIPIAMLEHMERGGGLPRFRSRHSRRTPF